MEIMFMWLWNAIQWNLSTTDTRGKCELINLFALQKLIESCLFGRRKTYDRFENGNKSSLQYRTRLQSVFTTIILQRRGVVNVGPISIIVMF